MGFEPTTPGLGSRCSTTELLPHTCTALHHYYNQQKGF
jgi:hypothetical protein